MSHRLAGIRRYKPLNRRSNGRILPKRSRGRFSSGRSCFFCPQPGTLNPEHVNAYPFFNAFSFSPALNFFLGKLLPLPFDEYHSLKTCFTVTSSYAMVQAINKRPLSLCVKVRVFLKKDNPQGGFLFAQGLVRVFS